MLFRRSNKKPIKERAQANLGVNQTFVLAKLGYDLRDQYESLAAAAFSEEIVRALERLAEPGKVQYLNTRKRRDQP